MILLLSSYDKYGSGAQFKFFFSFFRFFFYFEKEEFKYVRALGAFYLRITGIALTIYKELGKF